MQRTYYIWFIHGCRMEIKYCGTHRKKADAPTTTTKNNNNNNNGTNGGMCCCAPPAQYIWPVIFSAFFFLLCYLVLYGTWPRPQSYLNAFAHLLTQIIISNGDIIIVHYTHTHTHLHV